MKLLTENILFSILKNPKKAPRGNILADCPFCNKSGHFFIYKGEKKNRAHPFICHKCKKSGEINALLRKLDKTYLIEGERVTSLKVLDVGINVETEQEEHVDEVKNIKLPIGFTKLNYDDDSPYARYLIEDRNFTEQDFVETECGYTDIITKLIGYVIFPIKKDFYTKAYVSRDIINDAEFDDKRLRYRNSLSEFAKLFYGYDRLTSKTRIIILVEGVFDAIAINRKLHLYEQDEIVCLATFGNKISDDQIKMLKKFKGINDVFLMYDVRDSVEIMKKVGARLAKHYSSVKICYLISGDPDESSDVQILDALENATDYIEFRYEKVQIKKFT